MSKTNVFGPVLVELFLYLGAAPILNYEQQTLVMLGFPLARCGIVRND